jgi:predicted small metal-binding protein
MLYFSSDEVGPTAVEHAKKRDGDTDISEPKRKKKKLKSNKKKKVSLLCNQYFSF